MSPPLSFLRKSKRLYHSEKCIIDALDCTSNPATNKIRWNKVNRIGVVFHLFKFITTGRIGFTAIGRSIEESQNLFNDAVKFLDKFPARTGFQDFLWPPPTKKKSLQLKEMPLVHAIGPPSVAIHLEIWSVISQSSYGIGLLTPQSIRYRQSKKS